LLIELRKRRTLAVKAPLETRQISLDPACAFALLT
jgi:hypothetical protein